MTSERDAATDSMIRNLEAKTGKSLATWVAAARATGHTKHREILTHLKSAHGLSHGYANLVALEARLPARSIGTDPIDAQYQGAKQALRPIYDAVIAIVSRFGNDVEVAPKKAYVSLRRRKQFALVQPSTSTRLDIGLVLRGKPPKGRLEASGGFNAMVTHRVRAESKADLDRELTGWLKEAYDAS